MVDVALLFMVLFIWAAGIILVVLLLPVPYIDDRFGGAAFGAYMLFVLMPVAVIALYFAGVLIATLLGVPCDFYPHC